MGPDIFTREQLALEYRQALLCEAEHERMLAEVQNAAPHWLPRLAGRLGRSLIVLGARLHRFEQRGQVVEYCSKSSSGMNDCWIHSALYLSKCFQ